MQVAQHLSGTGIGWAQIRGYSAPTTPRGVASSESDPKSGWHVVVVHVSRITRDRPYCLRLLLDRWSASRASNGGHHRQCTGGTKQKGPSSGGWGRAGARLHCPLGDGLRENLASGEAFQRSTFDKHSAAYVGLPISGCRRRRCLFPRGPAGPPPDFAIASDVRDVDSSSVMVGGVTAANRPHVFRNSRRSSICVESGGLSIRGAIEAPQVCQAGFQPA